ncbi:hypothetical protein [Streptomyces sp. NPDC096153]|uniref:hypothetical protein n=1 Tax=Streptomyces sp. NPDC096153 TaxID=3155548 RepID=UPI0033180071
MPRTVTASFLDRTVTDVRGSAESWSATPLTERIALLERLLPHMVSRAPELAAAGAPAKRYAPDSPWAAEDWIGGPWALAQNAAAYLHALRRIAASNDPVGAEAVHEEDGRARVDVLIVHPRTEKAHREAVRSASADLRYVTLGVNCWSAGGFLLGFTPRGAHPGHTRQEFGSGIGFIIGRRSVGKGGTPRRAIRQEDSPDWAVDG